jgi:hypothetical protein
LTLKKSSLYRTRPKKTIPSTRPSILEGKFRLTTSQEQFLQADDGDIDKRLLFSTTENLLHLCAAETIYCDGTFYTAPPMFDQILLVMSCFRWYSPYFPKETLLHTTDSSHYSRILPADTTSTFLPQELAATYTFPTAELQGCLFHYAKAIWRKTQECGLQTDYKDVPDVTKLVRRAACLPLLPLNKVEDFWLYTLENAPPRDDCIKLTDYVTGLDRRTFFSTNLEPLPN